MSKPGTGPSRTSIVDIAKHAAVSPATVSRVFNNPDLVQDSTRDAVLKAARLSGYRPNASARTLRTRRSRVLGIVLPTLSNPVFAECLQGITSATMHAGYTIMPVVTHYELSSEQAAVEQLLSFGVDGMLLVVSDASSSKAVRRLQAEGVPYVLMYNRHADHPCVSVAGDTAMQEIVRGLVLRGHRRIGMVCGKLSSSDRAQQRYSGFMEAVERCGIEPTPLVQVPFMDTAIREIALALSLPQRPTALVCSNDLIAIRAIRAAHECDLRIPHELSITGFDGIAIGADLTPRLSTIAQPNPKMGADAVNWLVHSIQHNTLPQPQDSLTLPFSINWAESCAHAPTS